MECYATETSEHVTHVLPRHKDVLLTEWIGDVVWVIRNEYNDDPIAPIPYCAYLSTHLMPDGGQLYEHCLQLNAMANNVQIARDAASKLVVVGADSDVYVNELVLFVFNSEGEKLGQIDGFARTLEALPTRESSQRTLSWALSPDGNAIALVVKSNAPQNEFNSLANTSDTTWLVVRSLYNPVPFASMPLPRSFTAEDLRWIEPSVILFHELDASFEAHVDEQTVREITPVRTRKRRQTTRERQARFHCAAPNGSRKYVLAEHIDRRAFTAMHLLSSPDAREPLRFLTTLKHLHRELLVEGPRARSCAMQNGLIVVRGVADTTLLRAVWIALDGSVTHVDLLHDLRCCSACDCADTVLLPSPDRERVLVVSTTRCFSVHAERARWFVLRCDPTRGIVLESSPRHELQGAEMRDEREEGVGM